MMHEATARVCYRAALLILLTALASAGCGDDGASPVDTEAPSIALATPAAGAAIRDTVVVVEGTASDDDRVARITYRTQASYATGVAITPAASVEFSFAAPLAGEGPIELTVSAVDRAGNSSSAVVALTGLVPTYAAIGAGYRHACAVSNIGRAYCWGRNPTGQLGNDTTTESLVPVRVGGGLVVRVVSANGDSGFGHACAVTEGGAAYCWGDNTYGQLGSGSPESSSAPVAVSGDLSFESVTAGRAYTCGLTPAGKAYCWGDDTIGQLGGSGATGTPAEVSGGHVFESLVAGYAYTCGVTTDAELYCWGGIPWVDATAEPGKVSVTGQVAAVAIGRNHACALTTGGAAVCWGDNTHGQLGIGEGAAGASQAPVRVVTAHSFVAITAGDFHTCALTAGGAAYCWGNNVAGQLGDGTNDERPAPVAVVDGHTFASLAAGSFYTCGRTSEGRVYCWGNNVYGQLGAGADDVAESPRPMPLAWPAAAQP